MSACGSTAQRPPAARAVLRAGSLHTTYLPRARAVYFPAGRPFLAPPCPAAPAAAPSLRFLPTTSTPAPTPLPRRGSCSRGVRLRRRQKRPAAPGAQCPLAQGRARLFAPLPVLLRLVLVLLLHHPHLRAGLGSAPAGGAPQRVGDPNPAAGCRRRERCPGRGRSSAPEPPPFGPAPEGCGS